MFNAFPAAAESDATLVGDSLRTAHRYLSGIRKRLAKTDLSSRELDAVIDLLRACLARTLDVVSILDMAAPDSFPQPVILDAYTDVVHRGLFGLNPVVNVHRSRIRRPPKLPFGPVMRAALDEDAGGTDEKAKGGPARVALLEAARDVFVSRGYHGTRVDDIVDAANVSHGAFYRYFKNKDELAHLLAAQAMRTVSAAFLEIPELTNGGASRPALRRWLRTYNRAQVNEAAMIRVWVDAALQDDSLLADSASVLDWGRRRMAHFLRTRDFGDPDTDAVVLLALIDSFGVGEASSRAVDGAASIIERGFLGR